jgi:hypothetical protein
MALCMAFASLRRSGLPGVWQWLVANCAVVIYLPLLGLRAETKPIRVIPDEQMRSRPSQSLVDALNSLGMDIRVDNGIFTVSGDLRGGEVEVTGLMLFGCGRKVISRPRQRIAPAVAARCRRCAFNDQETVGRQTDASF